MRILEMGQRITGQDEDLLNTKEARMNADKARIEVEGKRFGETLELSEEAKAWTILRDRPFPWLKSDPDRVKSTIMQYRAYKQQQAATIK